MEKSDFSCSACPEKFDAKSKLIQHRYNRHGFGIKCKLCWRTFSSVSSCLTHLARKHSSEGYPCWKCDFETFRKCEFKSHVMKNHRNCLNREAADGEKKKKNNNNNNNLEVGPKRKSEGRRRSMDSMEKKNFPCDLCEIEFNLKTRLLRHRNEKHGMDIKCEICTRVFGSMVSLRSHRFTKHTGKDKVCEICGYSTKKTYDFKRHQVKHSNEYAVTCHVCNKGFYSHYEFNEHKNVHTAERPYQCEVCGVDYSRRSSLILHRNRKHPEVYDPSKRCRICDRVCLTKETMEAHVKTHVEGRKRYYCDICGKGLLTKVILKIHRRSHTGEKPFDCNYCGRGFSCKKNLAVHIRLHTGDRPYSCHVCWKAYTKSSALKAHEKTHVNRHALSNHPAASNLPGSSPKDSQRGKKKLAEFDPKGKPEGRSHSIAGNECDQCGNSFATTTKLLAHKKKTHGLDMNCEDCGKKFEKVQSYNSHVRNHRREKSFVCDVCGLATKLKSSLVNHRLVRHGLGEYRIRCRVCGKGFLSNPALRDHMNGHAGERPHQCHRCGLAYASIRSLEGHRRSRHPESFEGPLLRCRNCRRSFKSVHRLEEHEMAMHRASPGNVCDFCGKDFSFRESLVRHRRIHTGEKPKECKVCGKRFSCADHLRSHGRTHTGEKPYRCGFCWRKFSQRSSMVTHEKSHPKGLEIVKIVSGKNDSLVASSSDGPKNGCRKAMQDEDRQ